MGSAVNSGEPQESGRSALPGRGHFRLSENVARQDFLNESMAPMARAAVPRVPVGAVSLYLFDLILR